MSRVHADMACDQCGNSYIWLEGSPMICPKCGRAKEVKPITLEIIKKDKELGLSNTGKEKSS